MAGEVKSQLTVKLDGGAALASTPSSPISRSGQLTWGPGQSVSDYAGDRQTRFAREVAKEISRDREAARELAMIREKNRIRFEAEEIGSAVRAAEERMRRRDSLAQSVRENRQQTADGFFTESGMIRGARRGAVTSSRRLLRGFGAGIAAGFGSSLVMPASDDEGALGAFSRITLSTVSGGATLSELVKSMADKDKQIEEVRKAIAESRKEIRDLLSASEVRLAGALLDLKHKFDEDVRRVIVGAQDLRRREDQFEASNLLGN